MKVTLLEGTGAELQIENVTSLEFSDNSVTVNAFFEKPRIFTDVVVEKVDCLTHRVMLRRTYNSGGES
jgi:hypothetical protein